MFNFANVLNIELKTNQINILYHMNDNRVYIERGNCGDCYRCVRNCAIKAIKIENYNAQIIEELCVDCGMCIGGCPMGRIKSRDDIWIARKVAESQDVSIASISPSWVTEFPGVTIASMVETLKSLGFKYVSESSLGAQVVAQHEFEYMKTRPGLHISSRCPAINDYICKYRPNLAPRILPILSPMMAHAQIMRELYGENIKVVHISSCIASKKECEKNDIVDVAITFAELKTWLNDKGIDPHRITGGYQSRFEPHTPYSGLAYPLEKGNEIGLILKEKGIDNVKIMSKSGLYNIDKLIYKLPKNSNNETIYLDLLACENGCIQSCGVIQNTGSIIDKELLLLREIDNRKMFKANYELPVLKNSDITYAPIAVDNFVSEVNLIKALNSIGIYNQKEELNCNGCGYMNCRRFAQALVLGTVYPKMCTHYLRREFEDKFTILLAKMPSGVLVVDNELKIVDANRNSAMMLGTNAEAAFDATPGFNNVELNKIAPMFQSFVSSVLESGEDSIERDVHIRDKVLKVSVYTVQKYRLVLVIIRNIFHAEVRNEEIVTRTARVVKENLETVQKIANLLGDNAARTEAILNSILNAYSDEDVQ